MDHNPKLFSHRPYIGCRKHVAARAGSSSLHPLAYGTYFLYCCFLPWDAGVRLLHVCLSLPRGHGVSEWALPRGLPEATWGYSRFLMHHHPLCWHRPLRYAVIVTRARTLGGLCLWDYPAVSLLCAVRAVGLNQPDRPCNIGVRFVICCVHDTVYVRHTTVTAVPTGMVQSAGLRHAGCDSVVHVPCSFCPASLLL